MVKKRKKTKSPKTLNLFGIKLDYEDYVERFCVRNKIRSALKYNRCIYEQVYKVLGLEIVEPPALVLNVPEEEDPNEAETTPDTQQENPDNGTQTDTETQVTKTIEAHC